MRVRIRRRSVSSLVSPGPRVPMPPPSRDSAAPAPTSRGSRYFSCASSTCSLPSRVRARRAKMSRISCVRSTILRPTFSSMCRSCAGVSSLSKTTTSTSVSAQDAASVSILPAPRNVDGSGLGRSCSTRSTTSRAGGLGEAGELVERSLRVEPAGASARSIRRVPRARGGARACYGPRHVVDALPRNRARADERVASRRCTSTMVDGGTAAA